MQESYLGYYGLTSEPFSNAPVTRFYYESEQHKRAITRLLFALGSMKGLAVVIGGIGTGKTTLARRLLDALPDAEYESALLVIIHSGVDASWLLKRIAMQLGVVDPADDKLALLSQLYQRLVQIYESGKKAVVLIDEAQMLMTRELMEEFRGLLNLEVAERNLLSLVFFGLPEIDKIMLLDPPLKQRVALKFRLEGLSRESTEHYINHRLQLAGADRPIFTIAAIDVIFDSTGGTPRLINTVCDNSLLEGFLARSSSIEAPLVLTVVDNLGIDVSEYEYSLDTGSKERTDTQQPIARAAPVASHPPPAAPASDDASLFAAATTLSMPASDPEAATKRMAPIARAPAPRPAPPLAARPLAKPTPRPARIPPVASAPRPITQKPAPVATPLLAEDLEAMQARTVIRPQTSDLHAIVDAPTAAESSLEDEFFGVGGSPLLLRRTEPVPAANPSIKKTTVNLDEIDSLLAQIKKPIA